MPTTERRFTHEGVPAAVSAASRWVNGIAYELGLGDEDRYRLDLCVNELVSNIVDYSHAPGQSFQIDIAAEVTSSGVHLTFTDDGAAFDPLSIARPAAPMSLSDTSIGGFGIHLVREFADDAAYSRSDNRNCLTLVFCIGRAAHAGMRHAARGPDRRQAETTPAFPVQRADGTVAERDARSDQDRRERGFISRFRIFRNVPYSEVEDLVGLCPIREFPDGEVLLKPGEFSSHVALIVRGRLKICFDAPDSRDFVEIGVGDCAGEMSVIDGKPVSAYVVADGGCRLLLIEARTFLERLIVHPLVSRNLLSLLAERMRRGNARSVQRLQASLALEAMQRELRLAHDIQESMVPQRSPLFPDRRDIDCGARMRAAREVGGDFYDAFFIDSNRAFVTIGDVCGKGIGAALLMVRAVTLLRGEATRPATTQSRHVTDVMNEVNRQLAQNNPAGLFATVLCAVYDTGSGLLSYVNAGHNPPLFARSGGRFRELTEPRNMIAGIMEDIAYRVGEIAMTPGSTLVLFTDGVTEAEDSAARQFGTERLVALLDASRDRSSTTLIELVFREVEAFTNGHPQSDDIAMLVLHVPETG